MAYLKMPSANKPAIGSFYGSNISSTSTSNAAMASRVPSRSARRIANNGAISSASYRAAFAP